MHRPPVISQKVFQTAYFSKAAAAAADDDDDQ